jgi:hypothetical protein
MKKYIIKNTQGKTVVKTMFATTVAQYNERPGYKVVEIPVTR